MYITFYYAYFLRHKAYANTTAQTPEISLPTSIAGTYVASKAIVNAKWSINANDAEKNLFMVFF